MMPVKDELQKSRRDVTIELTSHKWHLGQSGYDTVHKIPHKIKRHWQNQLKRFILVYFNVSIELDAKR